MRIHLQPRQKKTLGVLVVGGIIVCTLCAVGTTYVGIRRHAFVSYPESAYQQTSFSSGSTDILAVVPQANMPTAQSVYKGAVSPSRSSSVSSSMSPSVSSSMSPSVSSSMSPSMSSSMSSSVSPSRSVSMSSSVSPSRSVSMSPSVSSGALVTMSDRTMQSYGGAYGGTIQGGVSARQQTDAVCASGSVSVPSIPTIAYRGSVRDRYGLAGVAVSTDGRAVIRRGRPGAGTGGNTGGDSGSGDSGNLPQVPMGDALGLLLLMAMGKILGRVWERNTRNI